jgi:glutamate synthase domain-containing protein 3
MVELESMTEEDKVEVKSMVEKHFQYTGSDPAEWILENWEAANELFVKVMPKDYKAVLQKQKAAKVLKQPQPVLVSK